MIKYYINREVILYGTNRLSCITLQLTFNNGDKKIMENNTIIENVNNQIEYKPEIIDNPVYDNVVSLIDDTSTKAFLKAVKLIKENNLKIEHFKSAPKYDHFKKTYNEMIKEFKSGKNILGHHTSKISGMIDYYLLSSNMTAKQIAKKCNCTEQRVIAHIQRDLKKGMRSKGKVKCSVIYDDNTKKYQIALKTLV